MKLVDTSVWIDFLRGRPSLSTLAEHIRDGTVLADLALFPAAPEVRLEELLTFTHHHALGGIGLGLVDVQLMASARVAGADLLTGDRRLAAAWSRLSPGPAS